MPGIYFNATLSKQLVSTMKVMVIAKIPFKLFYVKKCLLVCFQVKNWSQADKDWGARLQRALDEFKSVSISYPQVLSDIIAILVRRKISLVQLVGCSNCQSSHSMQASIYSFYVIPYNVILFHIPCNMGWCFILVQ